MRPETRTPRSFGPTPRRLGALLTALTLALLTTPALAHDDFWMEFGGGSTFFTGMRTSDGAAHTQATLGFATSHETGVEFSSGVTLDAVGAVASVSMASHMVWLPDEDFRLRIGGRLRVFEDIAGEGQSTYLTGYGDEDIGARSVDSGIDLGIVSRWTLGPLYLGVEWVGLYQPLVAHYSELTYARNGIETRTEETRWKGTELPAEIRAFTLLFGLAF